MSCCNTNPYTRVLFQRIYISILFMFCISMAIYGYYYTVRKQHTTKSIIESMITEEKSRLSSDFCAFYSSTPKALREEATKLTKDNCMNTKCTVYMNVSGNEKCVAGDVSGPLYRTENGEPIEIDSYYYFGKCYGNHCPKE